MKIKYNSKEGILTTMCPFSHKDSMIRVGSYACKQCPLFKSIDRDAEIVVCGDGEEE